MDSNSKAFTFYEALIRPIYPSIVQPMQEQKDFKGSHFPWESSRENDGDNSDHTASEEHSCPWHQISWIWRFSQILGINPLTISCNQNEQRVASDSSILHSGVENSHCKMALKKISYAFTNTFMTLAFFVIMSSLLSKTIDPVVKVLFKGTDAYAFKIHFLFRVTQTIVVAFCGFLFNKHFIRGWDSIQVVAKAMKMEFPQSIGRWSKALTLLSFLLGIVNFSFTIFLGVRLCFCEGNEMNNSTNTPKLSDSLNCLGFDATNFILFVWLLSGSEFAHLTLSSLLFVISLIVKHLHNRLAELMKKALTESSSRDNFVYESQKDQATEVERLRLIYEEMQDMTIHLRRYFGPACLFTCCDGIVTCVFGVYWRLIYFENWEDKEFGTSDYYYFILFTLHLNYSLYSLIMILVSGHTISSSALKVVRVIRKSKLQSIDSPTRFQLNLFMQVGSGYNARFSVYSITNLEMPFLAAATTNVITYLLVMMQFRMEQSNK